MPATDRHIAFEFDTFMVDPVAWRLFRHDREIHLEPVVLKLLVYLITHRDRLVTRQELMDTVWGDTVISDSALSKAIARLRKALDEDPAAPRYLETVHAKGYRFVAEVHESGQDESAEQSVGKMQGLTARHATIIGIAVVLLVTLGFVFWKASPLEDEPTADEIRSLAVLPLKNLTGNSSNDFKVNGLQDTLITELSQIGGLRLTSRQSTIRYNGSDKPLPEIAEELGVDTLVEGSVLQAGERIEVNLQLIDGRTDEHLWAQHFEREASYAFDILTNAAEAIGSEFGLSADRDPVGPVDTRAIRAYWRGLDNMTRFSPTSLAEAITNFRTATEIEPDFARAWGSLAAAHTMLAVLGFAPPQESMENARFAAQEAIRASGSAIGYAALGWVNFWSQQLTDGCDAFREALRSNPSSPGAIHGDADCLLLEGREEESLERIRDLTLIAPFTIIHQIPISYHLFLARRYDEALAVTLDIQKRFPGSPMHVNLSLIYWQQGLYEKALAEDRSKYELYKDDEMMELFDGNLAEADPRALMRAVAEVLVRRSESVYVDAFEIGEAYARAGAVDEAVYWLNRALEQKSLEAVHLPFRPDFDGLRDDPRFAELVDRVSLPSAQPSH